jgi:CubicO group peptidase (beta-lactamase class C family)
MNDSYVFSMDDSLTAIRSFTPSGGVWAWDFLDNTYGDKNIYTTPQDLLRWSLAVSNYNIISKELLDTAFSPMSNDKPSVHNYGLGWRMLLLPNGKKVVYHNGRWHGSNAAFAKLQDEHITIIIIGNRFTYRIYNTSRRSYDLFGQYLQTDPAAADESDAENSTTPATSKEPSKSLSPKKGK